MWDSLSENERFPKPRVRLSPRRYGEYLARSPEEGVRYVRAAALAGRAKAQLGFGHMLLDGYGVAKDEAAALRWFYRAAAQGDLDATNMVARCHETGWGTSPDRAAAMYWYGLAAEKSHDWAQFNLATLILSGDPDDVGVRAALSLLVASARSGNPKAMNTIGRFREQGWGGSKKPRAAALWFRLAAQGGCFRGQFHHARFLMREGKSSEARRWLRASLREAPTDFLLDAIAILTGHPDAGIRAIAEEARIRARQ